TKPVTKYGARSGRKAAPEKKPVTRDRAGEPPPVPLKPSPVNRGFQLALGRNHWRAGKDFYDNNDFVNAKKNFSKVVELNPKSVEAANARRLLGNIKLAQGKLALKSRSAKAAGAQVQLDIQVGNKALDDMQVTFVEMGLKASREGRMGEAKKQFKAAQALGDQLGRQGADARKQHARLREAQKQLGSIEKRERKEAEKLYKQVEEFEEQGNIEDALETAQKLQEYDYGRTRGVQKKLQKLTVQAAKQKAVQARTKALTGRFTTLEHFDAPERSAPGQTNDTVVIAGGDVARRSGGEETEGTGIQRQKLQSQRDVREQEPERVVRRRDTGGGKRAAPGKQHGEDLFGDEDGRPGSGAPRPRPQGGTAGGHFLGYGKGGQTTRKYDISDLTVDFSGVRGGANGQDAGTILMTDGDEDGDGVNGKELARQLNEAVAPITWQRGRGKQPVAFRNGQLIVTDGAVVQEQVRKVLSDLRKTRGPQVQLGGNIAQQKALGIVTESEGKGRGEGKPDAPAFQSFYYRNYAWQESPRKSDRWGFDSGAATVSGVASKLRFNRGQKVDVNSINLNLSGSTAGQLGVQFSSGNNALRFARVDEATFRTLVELDAKTGRRVVSPSQRFQETIVGTDALVANDMTANVTFAADAGNTLNITNNPITLKHEDYILIDNNGYLTAVKA
ncbi:hypothetical protein HQ560_12875, partial [bacterium]|nr:hypothetical protein [bacterium]